MATNGSVSVRESSAHGSGDRADCTNDHRPCHCSSGPQTSTKFVGKTIEMNSKIFDVRAVQGARFLSTQGELSKFLSRNNLKGHQAANAVKDLRPITYTEPPETKFKEEAGSDLSDIKQKLELYKYEALLKKLEKEKVDDDAIMKQEYAIANGKCTEAVCNELDSDSGLERIAKEGYVIGLLKIIKQICYNIQSHKYSQQDIHDTIRKFYVQAQDLSMSVTE